MRRRHQLAIGTLAIGLAVSCSHKSTRLKRPTISGRVVLASADGLNDYDQVAIDIGRGEGPTAPAADGTFSFSVGSRRHEAASPVPYQVAWAMLLARVYDVDGHLCPDCGGVLRPVGAVLPPEAASWMASGRIRTLPSTGPPGAGSRQLELPLAS